MKIGDRVILKKDGLKGSIVGIINNDNTIVNMYSIHLDNSLMITAFDYDITLIENKIYSNIKPDFIIDNDFFLVRLTEIQRELYRLKHFKFDNEKISEYLDIAENNICYAVYDIQKDNNMPIGCDKVNTINKYSDWFN